ncbi:MAG: flagellar type III secretion system pore protein FliP [Planctomycetota bacterium]
MRWLLVLLLMLQLPLGAVEAQLHTPGSSREVSRTERAEGLRPEATVARDGPGLSVSLRTGDEVGGWSQAVQLLLLLTVLAVAPGFLFMLTAFTRVIIVLGFLRRALGTQTLPPNQVLLGLALFLTLFIMTPTIQEVYSEAYQPYISEEIGPEEAIDRASSSVRSFMAKHTRETDLALFIRIAGEERPRTLGDVSFATLVPAFVTSELKTAFQMGFVLFLPFLVVDIVIAALLMALGMMMLPPVVISLPFKILIFVLVDGWVLIMQGLVASYA